MNRKKTFTLLAVGTVAIVSVVGLMAFKAPAAQASAAQSLQRIGLAHGGFGWEDGDGPMGQYLADALGITLEELQAAYQQANEAAINQAVDEGLITQAQADAMLARGGAMPFGSRMGGWLANNGIDFEALLADTLSITVDDLQAAYAAAADARIEQAIQDGTLTQEEADLIRGRQALFSSESFQSAIRSAFEAAVNQAVESGLITQAQADQILANTPFFGGQGGFGGFHGPGGFGRHGRFGHPGWFGDPGNPITPEEQPTSPTSFFEF
jgi:hypothetical protein